MQVPERRERKTQGIEKEVLKARHKVKTGKASGEDNQKWMREKGIEWF